jgi:hypothetical protein
MAMGRKGVLDFTDDAINKAMLDGLKYSFDYQIKKELMEIAEEKVDCIVKNLSERLKVMIDETPDILRHGKFVKLSWFLNKEK